MTFKRINTQVERPAPEEKPLPDSFEASLDTYKQLFLGAKARGELTPRIVFNQMNNSGETLKLTSGKYGRGAYTTGKMIDRNTESMPQNYQHSTDPSLIMSAENFEDEKTARDAGYVGLKYDDGSYFLFGDTVPQQNRNTGKTQLTKTYSHPITGEQFTLNKDGRRWTIEGLDGKFRSEADAIKHIESDLPY